MKRLVILIFLMFSLRVFAPESNCFLIYNSSPIRPYEKLIYAVGMVESSCDTLAYNPKEGAVGYFQIRAIRLKDYNRRNNKNYKLHEMYDFDKALDVFMYYVTPDMEYTCKAWNGRGKSNKVYWQKVSKLL